MGNCIGGDDTCELKIVKALRTVFLWIPKLSTISSLEAVFIQLGFAFVYLSQFDYDCPSTLHVPYPVMWQGKPLSAPCKYTEDRFTQFIPGNSEYTATWDGMWDIYGNIWQEYGAAHLVSFLLS